MTEAKQAPLTTKEIESLTAECSAIGDGHELSGDGVVDLVRKVEARFAQPVKQAEPAEPHSYFITAPDGFSHYTVHKDIWDSARFPGWSTLPLFTSPSAAPAIPEWISVKNRLPPHDDRQRILIYTEGYDFNGEQFFDITADDLHDIPARQSEVAARASHWMPRPFPVSEKT